MFKYSKWAVISILVTITSYVGILLFPSFLYSYEHKNKNLNIYCDEKFPENINHISNEVLNRIEKSEYFDKDHEYNVFISNKSWRWKLVSHVVSDVGAVNFSLYPSSSFVRPSIISENRIIPPGNGLADANERDLIYFISHEIAHGMMAIKLGFFVFNFKTEHWIKEGYADHIGKKSFDFRANFHQFLIGEKRLTEESGLYVRYHLFLFYLLNDQKLNMKEIVRNNPPQKNVFDKIMHESKNLTSR